MSPDAKIFAGVMLDDNGRRPFRWRDAALEVLPTPAGGYAQPYAMTPDGSIVAGTLDMRASRSGDSSAVRWDGAGQSLYRNVEGFDSCGAGGLSIDGVFTVGTCGNVFESGGRLAVQSVAVRWEGHRAEALPSLPGEKSSNARDISSDGSVIVGQVLIGEEYAIFVWTAQEGKRLLRSLLAEAGHGGSFDGWQLRVPVGVSDDGRIVVGVAVDPTGRRNRAFRAVLP